MNHYHNDEEQHVIPVKVRKPTDEQAQAIFKAFGLLVAFVPERWRALATAVVAAVALIVGAFWGINTGTIPSPVGGPAPTFAASAITIDQKDVNLRVSTKPRPEVDHTHGKVQETKLNTAGIAPLMNWENSDVREGSVQTWFLKGRVVGGQFFETDAEAQDVFRQVMNELAALYPNNVRWQEVQHIEEARYTYGPTAQFDCGIGDGAVACAVYMGRREGAVSYNGNLRTQGVLDRADLVVGIAHEFQHIELNLGHNNCGYPVRSVMTPMDLNNSSSCSNPPATGLTIEDHGNQQEGAVKYYDLKPQPFVPTPTPPPTVTMAVNLQQWQWVNNAWKVKDDNREVQISAGATWLCPNIFYPNTPPIYAQCVLVGSESTAVTVPAADSRDPAGERPPTER